MTRISALITLITLLIFTNTAHAQGGLLPALYDVAGVAANDVLNVREQAGASHAIIATLAPGAQNIEVVAISDDGRWGLVGNSEISGWTSMRFLVRQRGQDDVTLPRPLYCFGTEPFWDLELGRLDNELAMPSGTLSKLSTAWEGTAYNRGAGAYGLVLEQSTVSIHAVISREQCDDGMSDGTYGFNIQVILTDTDGTGMLSGCCSLARY